MPVVRGGFGPISTDQFESAAIDESGANQILEHPGSKVEVAILVDLVGSTPQHLFRPGFLAGEREEGYTPALAAVDGAS